MNGAMRKLLLFFLLAVSAWPDLAATRNSQHDVTITFVTVADLEKTLAATHANSDDQQAQQISTLELTERLSQLHRATLDAALPGSLSRRALATLADKSEFLDLPALDILATPAPERTAQVAVLALARSYVVKTITKLPNFFATRETTSLEGAPAKSPLESSHPSRPDLLHEVSRASVTVLYRDNHEQIVKTRKDYDPSASKKLQTLGEFGPVLVTVLNDAARGRITWSHWEQGTAGPTAVFRYAIPVQESHYMVSSSSFDHEAKHDPAYHGELAINPKDGSILRLTAVAELNPNDALTEANLLVEYGPIEIGDVTYICPIKSVALSQVRMVVQTLNFATAHVESTSLGPARNYLNEVLFENYHLFRADARILAGNDHDPPHADPSESPSKSIPK